MAKHGLRARRSLERQEPPPGIWGSSWNLERACEIVERLAAGESLASVCRRDPAMPTEKTVWNWAQRNPAFGERLAWAREEARASRLAARAEQEAVRGAATAARRRARGLKPAKDTYSVARGDAVCFGLIEGATITEVCARPGMPSVATVYNWLRRYPDFVRSYRIAREMQCELVVDMAIEEMQRLGPRGQKALAKAVRRRLGWLALKAYAGPTGARFRNLPERA